MARRFDRTLGDGPVLPMPDAPSMARATELFQRILAADRRGGVDDTTRVERRPDAPRGEGAPAAGGEWAGPSSLRSPRRYDLAMAKIYRGGESVEVPESPDDGGDSHGYQAAALPEEATLPWGRPPPPPELEPESEATSEVEGEVEAEGAALSTGEDAAPDVDEASHLLHPPRGAVGRVRPSAPVPERPTEVSTDVLENTASQSLFYATEDGGAAFDVTISDDVFTDLRCTVRVHEGHVLAVFHVGDVNTRRLLEGEAGQLRARLEARGLRVDGIAFE